MNMSCTIKSEVRRLAPRREVATGTTMKGKPFWCQCQEDIYDVAGISSQVRLQHLGHTGSISHWSEVRQVRLQHLGHTGSTSHRSEVG